MTMDNRKQRNLATLGLLMIVATVMFVFGLYWLLGTPLLRGGMDVTVILDNGAGLKRSDGVQLQGVAVGMVRSVRLNSAGPGVIVELRLNDQLALPADSRATVRGDVFGAHTVDLIPGSSLVRLAAGDTVRGVAVPELTQVATDLSARVEAVLTSADALLAPSAVRDVHATVAVMPAGAEQLRVAFAELALASAALRRTAERVETADTGERLNHAIGEFEQTARALTAAAGRMEQSLGTFASVLDKIDNGSGTLGRMVNDTTMYAELNHTLREMRALAADVRERPSRYINLRIF
jgi:phospholipid/cholesterol/gamma-HCH transport system substrate-binding protein